MESERLYFRAFEISDAPEVYELAKDNEVGPCCGWKPHESVEETKIIIRDILMNEGTYCVCEKGTDYIIGSMSLEKDPIRNNDKCRMLGYWIGKEFWGKGYAPEAANKLLNFGFESLGLDLISVYHYPFNLRSKRVIEKLGFQYDGILREYTRRFDGVMLDYVLYSLDKKQFYK